MPDPLLAELPWLRQLARRLAGDEAEDLAQDTFLLAARDRPPGVAGGGLRAWLARVMRNRHVSRRRSATARARREAASEANDPAPDLDRVADVLRIVEEALAVLSEDDRDLLKQRFFEGRTAAEIAAARGIAAATVRSRLHRALLRLRSFVDQRHGNDRARWAPAVLALPASRPSIGWLAMASTTKKLSVVLLFAALAAALWWLVASMGGDADDGAATAAYGGDGASERADTGAEDWIRGRRAAALESRLRAPRGAFAGRVVDERGEPIAAATVCARAVSNRLPHALVREPTCAVAGSDGRYRIAPLVPDRYRVDASAPRHVPAGYAAADGRDRIELSAGQERGGIDVTLASGGVAVRGVVRDISGGVIGGAVVSILDPRRYPGSTRGAAVRTDDEGKFLLWAEPGAVRVRASAEGYASGTAKSIAPGRQLEVDLTPGSTLVGRVVDAQTGESLAGVPVTIGGGWRAHNRTYPRTAFTDEGGRFRFEGLTPGGYTPEVRTQTLYGRASRRVALGFVQQSEPVTIEAHPAASVRGAVLTTQGEPCARGHVTLTSKDTGHEFAAPVELEGQVELVALLPGTYRVAVSCTGRLAPAEYPDVPVDVDPVTGLRWEVEVGHALSGQVVDDHGNAIAGATVHASPVSPEGRAQRAFASTASGADGRFTLSGLTTDRYEVGAFKAGWLRAEDEAREVGEGAGPQELTLTLSRGGTVRGQVTDAEGAAVGGVFLRFDGAAIVEFLHNRDDGTFERTGVTPGSYRVWAAAGYDDPLRAPGLGDDDLPGQRVEVAGGEVAVVNLVVEQRDGALRGTVVGPDGPVADAFVGAGRESEAAGKTRPVGSLAHRTLTDVDGTFEIDGLRPGRYTLEAERRGGGGLMRVEHVELGAEVTLVLEETASLAGSITAQDGSVPERFQVEVMDPTRLRTGQSQSLFRVDGQWRFDGLRPGTYRLRASSPGGVAEGDVTLAAGEFVEGVALRLVDRATVTGRVVDLVSGEPLAQMHIQVGGARGTAATFGSYAGREVGDIDTGEDGRFEIDNVPSGRIALYVSDWSSARRYAPAVVFASVPAGGATLPDIVMAPKRTETGERGDLGLRLVELRGEQSPERVPLRVAYVRPGGPAEAAGVRVDDVIVAADGHDVTGGRRYLYDPLSNVTPGTTISLAGPRPPGRRVDHGRTARVTPRGPRGGREVRSRRACGGAPVPSPRDGGALR